MSKYITVKGHIRKGSIKSHRVKTHKRKKKKQGRKITYKKVGIFYVAHDQYGNFRGSKVEPIRNRRRLTETQKKKIYTDYFRGKITSKQMNESLQ